MAIDLHEPATLEKPLKRKKSKKDLTADAPVEEQVEEDSREKKRRKKEERRKRKEEAEEMGAGETAVVEDPPAKEKKSKKEKGKKEKKLTGDTRASQPADSPDAETATQEQSIDKKKKRKRDAEDAANSASLAHDEPTSSKKDKKKKQKADKADSSTTPPLTPAEIDAYFAEHNITITVPAGGAPVVPVLSFDTLVIPDALRSAFAGFSKPTPVQACTWPPMLDQRDVVGIAETGSGKTLAFGIPALARLISSPVPAPSKKSKSSHSPRVLILAPTRELALQSHDVLKPLGEQHGIRSVAVFGGVSKEGQVKELRAGAHIVVGTPGRIKDLVGDEALDLSKVDYLVLDEADRMLDKGFENDIRMIIGWTQSEGRQTLMFSATWPDAVRRLAASFQRDPVRVTVGSDDLTANSRVEQVLEVFDDDREKDSRLLKHLQKLLPKKSSNEQRILIFALYKKEAARLEETLRRRGYTVTGLHGDMAQQKRLDALQSFRDGTTRLLVATDVAARGLDIPDVGVVLNYTFPLTIEDYIHRIGRTGRGGKSGKSITFFTGDKHERALAGELAGILRDGGFDQEADKLSKFPMSVKKKTHSVYGAFFRDDVDMSAAPTRITFD